MGISYLRLLKTSAAATATITTTTAPKIAYVAVGVALVGGCTTGLGVGAIVWVGAAVAGAVVGGFWFLFMSWRGE